MKSVKVQICETERILFDNIDYSIMVKITCNGYLIGKNGKKHKPGVSNSRGYIVSPKTIQWLGFNS